MKSLEHYIMRGAMVMKNFSKLGYSVAEVAQICHVVPATIRNWIDSGVICAHILQNDKRRTIRIGQDQLAEFMKKNPGKFSVEDTKPFEKYLKDPLGKNNDEPEETSVPTGAWAGLIEQNTIQEEPSVFIEKKNNYDNTYNLLVNGRIAVGNITLQTAKQMLSILMDDPVCDVNSVSIERL
jgi:hypothetical protein